ncbi:hypothetical protein TCE0_024f07717 [Talaromyces pinophilus]|uniref:AN1-type domain-containing protein n=1 Tax=Talaromyces pinophilus TaxID=128442 RepID=A0A6V8H8H3_TALPI|nr:hypothetical protein TCE0_024f07717 [Talaromyces pinophilus]
MPLRTCEADGCSDPAERGAGSCMICARHYCSEHKKKSYHKCPSEDDEDTDAYWAAYNSAKIRCLAALLDEINVNAMETIIGQVRGVRCRIPALDADLNQAAKIEFVSSQMGGQNCHVDAEFEEA